MRVSCDGSSGYGTIKASEKIVKTKDETIVLQVGADKVRMEMMRWSISKVVKEGKNHNKATADDYEEMGDAEEKEVKKSKPKRMKKAAPVVEEEPVVEVKEEAAEVAEEAVEETAPAVEEAPAEEIAEAVSEAAEAPSEEA